MVGFFGTENLHAYTEKPMHTKRVTVWSAFWSRGIIGQFFFENEKERPLQLMVIVIRATLPKLHSIFCALLLKIALSAAELMSFGHLGAAFCHYWIIICEVPSKISVTPTSQRQLTL